MRPLFVSSCLLFSLFVDATDMYLFQFNQRLSVSYYRILSVLAIQQDHRVASIENQSSSIFATYLSFAEFLPGSRVTAHKPLPHSSFYPFSIALFVINNMVLLLTFPTVIHILSQMQVKRQILCLPNDTADKEVEEVLY